MLTHILIDEGGENGALLFDRVLEPGTLSPDSLFVWGAAGDRYLVEDTSYGAVATIPFNMALDAGPSGTPMRSTWDAGSTPFTADGIEFTPPWTNFVVGTL